MENVSSWTLIIVALISGLLGQPVMQLIIALNKRKHKKFFNAVEAKGLIELSNDKFRNEFILPDFEETYFYSQTGIKTNYKSIPMYIELKDKLGNNYTWKPIREAKPHLIFCDGKLEVSLNRFQRILKNIFIVVGLLFIVVGVLVTVFINEFQPKTATEIVLVILFMIIPMIIGYLTVNSVQSLVSASLISKRLKVIENQ